MMIALAALTCFGGCDRFGCVGGFLGSTNRTRILIDRRSLRFRFASFSSLVREKRTRPVLSKVGVHLALALQLLVG